MGSVKSLRN